MAKRLIAGILGAIAVVASLLPLGYAFEGFGDFQNPGVPFWSIILGIFIMCSIALVSALLGFHFLRFALTGRSWQSGSWVKPVLLGIGFFLPGFVFSFPITILWVDHTWPGGLDTGKSDLAFEASAFVGVVAAIVCTIVLLRRHVKSHGRISAPD